MKTCKYCKRNTSFHYCTATHEYETPSEQSSSDPLLSAVVGAATGSTLLGFAIGGSLSGALLGDALDGDIFGD